MLSDVWTPSGDHWRAAACLPLGGVVSQRSEKHARDIVGREVVIQERRRK